MKQSVSPAIVAVVVIVVVGAVGFFLWKGTGGGSTKAPGSTGNSSPFAPGGRAQGKGGAMPAGSGRPITGGPPGGIPGR